MTRFRTLALFAVIALLCGCVNSGSASAHAESLIQINILPGAIG